MICVFDCETIPDFNLIRKIYHLEGSNEEVAKIAYEEQVKKTGSSFLPIIFHEVVAISAVIADDFGMFIRVSSMDGENEHELLKSFLSFIDRKNPKLVSFNGRGFDLPMLMCRAMKYNLSCTSYFEVDNRELNKSKWENYRTRYNDRFHIDLMDAISDYGAVRGLKLDEVCSMVNLPGKYDVSGDQVLELYLNNEIEKIKEYCESDVLNTYWLYIKYELLKGNITKEDYFRYLSVTSDKLPDSREYKNIFKEKIDNELKSL